MPYVPTLSDIPQPEAMPTSYSAPAGASSPSKGSYIPTLADIPPPASVYTPTHTGLLWDVAAAPVAIASGVAEGTRNLANLAGSGLNYISRKLGGSEIVPHLRGVNLTEALGLPEEKTIEQLSEIIPALAGADMLAPLVGAARVSEAVPMLTRGIQSQAVGGAAYSAAQAQKQGRSLPEAALMGAGLGAAGGAVGEALSAIGRPIGSYISREIMPSITQKASALITKDEPESSALIPLGERLNAARAKAAQWAPELKEAAEKADKGKGFDNTHYKDTTMSILKDLKEQENEDPTFYSPVVKAVQEKLDFIPKSYSSAVAQRSALNRMPSTWELTNKPIANMLKGISGKMKGALDEQIDKNAQDNPEAQDLANKWKDHRRNYQFLKSFDQTPVAMRNQAAVLKYNKPQAESLVGEVPTENALQHFLPKSTDKDILKMEHFANLTGNPELARQALKAEYVRAAYEGTGDLNPNILLNKFKKLSPKQQQYLFSPAEQKLLKSALSAKGAGRKAFLHHLGVRYGTPIGVGGLIGSGVTEEEGKGWLPGMAIGAGLGAGLTFAPRFMATSKGAAIAKRLAEQGFKKRPLTYPINTLALPLFQGSN